MKYVAVLVVLAVTGCASSAPKFPIPTSALIQNGVTTKAWRPTRFPPTHPGMQDGDERIVWLRIEVWAWRRAVDDACRDSRCGHGGVARRG